MQTNKLFIAAVAAFTLGTVAHSGTAQASSTPITKSVVVHYGDLNLQSASGVRRLHKRIHNAAETVCSSLETRVLGLRDAYEQCVAKAVADGIASVDNENLTSYHVGRKVPAFESNRS